MSVRVKGEAVPNEATGQVTTIFNENPEQPFTNVKMHFKEGALAPIANPLTCGNGDDRRQLLPVHRKPARRRCRAASPSPAARRPLPFALTQSTQNQTGNAGGHTSFTFNLTRDDGEQYLSQVKTTLPPGLVGAIPAVTPCTEAQASLERVPGGQPDRLGDGDCRGRRRRRSRSATARST